LWKKKKETKRRMEFPPLGTESANKEKERKRRRLRKLNSRRDRQEGDKAQISAMRGAMMKVGVIILPSHHFFSSDRSKSSPPFG